jgi:hypothetical protein
VCERDLGAFGAAAYRHPHCPGLQRKPVGDARHHHVCRFEQRDPCSGVAGLGDGALSIGVAGLVAASLTFLPRVNLGRRAWMTVASTIYPSMAR